MADRVQRARPRMGGAHLVVAVGGNEQQETRVRLGEQMFDELQAGRIGPLHVVEEQCERMFLAAEHRQEALKHQAEPVFRLDWRQRRYRRLWADDERDLRQDLDDQLTVDADGGLNLLTPGGDAFL